jgi:cob(I)alamin adenosyltransferase
MNRLLQLNPKRIELLFKPTWFQPPCHARLTWVSVGTPFNKRSLVVNTATKQGKGTVKGLVILFTGNGKGKTSAAMGILARASGRDLSVGVIQFIKSPDLTYGEACTARKLNIPFQSRGDGFVRNRSDQSEAEPTALEAWEEAKHWICSQAYDVLILDEVTYLFYFQWLEVQEFIAWIRQNKPGTLHLVLTGRYAPNELIDFADLVTEMREIKHPFREQGIPAQPGVDF